MAPDRVKILHPCCGQGIRTECGRHPVQQIADKLGHPREQAWPLIGHLRPEGFFGEPLAHEVGPDLLQNSFIRHPGHGSVAPRSTIEVFTVTGNGVFLKVIQQIFLELFICFEVFAPHSVQEFMPEDEEIRLLSLRAPLHEHYIFNGRSRRAADACLNGRTVLENDDILPENTPDLFQPERGFAVLPHWDKPEALLIHAEFGRRMSLELVQYELFVSLLPFLRVQSVRPCLGFRRNPALLTFYGPKQLPLYSFPPIFLKRRIFRSFASSGYIASHFWQSSKCWLISSSRSRSSRVRNRRNLVEGHILAPPFSGNLDRSRGSLNSGSKSGLSAINSR